MATRDERAPGFRGILGGASGRDGQRHGESGEGEPSASAGNAEIDHDAPSRPRVIRPPYGRDPAQRGAGSGTLTRRWTPRATDGGPAVRVLICVTTIDLLAVSANTGGHVRHRVPAETGA
jgi:hypothetical protein